MAAAIKGRAALDCIMLPKMSLRSPEQLIGGASMGLGIRQVAFDPDHFAFQELDPFVKLGHRERPEILFANQRHRIGRPGGKEVVLIHACQR